MVACSLGHCPLVRLLLDERASVGEVEEGRGTPLISAASAGNVDCVRMLVDEGDYEVFYQEFKGLNG